ncbi:beta-N-acetylhexosaminidase [Catellatospora bangladeshensis]|uniref:beta-N-acetylhexosaminidase n=1 Tax=Catellatospora bangladeshensis TaxID=310355 RepID=A0A8J3JGB6_9ACTN|nr:beta-N-acetylhexosaminidase [Catellatospora bangladeshensis]GIF84051.1 beta-hexosaminidase [Catellatospora bangladeshensis]
MLIPQPTSYSTAPGHHELTAATAVHAPAEIAALLRELLSPVTGLPLPDAAAHAAELLFTLDTTETELGEEGYRLTVGDDGVRAVAGTLAGLRWAVQALRQLLPPAACGSTPAEGVAWLVPYAEITDRPRYAWRGVLIDVGRWYQPVSWLRTVVDLLALHRMNVLHLHLTEDQGWRFEVRRYPLLTGVGARRRESPVGHENIKQADRTPHDGWYTQDELRELVAYAARRGVTVVPEIDLPGHTTAAIAAYPELGNDPAARLETGTRWGVYSTVLNCDDATVDFMRHVLDELVDVFPAAYVHLGGDEVPPGEWAANPAARERMVQLGLTDPEDLLGWWITVLADHLRTHGRRVVVWDELVKRGAPADAVVMAWRDEAKVAAALEAGHDVIATPQSHVYLDHAESDRAGEPLSIGGHSPLDRVYGYDPEPADAPDGGNRVIGVQGNLWGEYLPTVGRAAYSLLPRLSAIAEAGWGTRGEYADFRARLDVMLARFDALGVAYRRPDPLA